MPAPNTAAEIGREGLLALAARVEAATGADRSIDRAIGFAIGLGVEKERKLYVEMGDAMWVPTPELRGLTPYDRARGSTIRSEWVKGSRGRKGHYQDVRWGACDGPQPLTNSPLYTASLDAAMMLASDFGGQVSFFKDGTAKAYLWQAYPLAVEAKAATAPLALTAASLRAIAALKARAVGDGEGRD